MLKPLDNKTKVLLELADFVEKSNDYDHLDCDKCFIGHYNQMTNYTLFLSNLFNDHTNLDYLKLVVAKPFGWDFNTCEELEDEWYPNSKQAASCLRHYALTGIVDWKRVRDQETTNSPATLVS